MAQVSNALTLIGTETNVLFSYYKDQRLEYSDFH